jgi:hypothetical protein
MILLFHPCVQVKTAKTNVVFIYGVLCFCLKLLRIVLLGFENEQHEFNIKGERLMKRLVFLLVTLVATSSFAEVKEKDFKHWYFGIGPAFSDALVGNGGTKYDVALGYIQGLSERLDNIIFYDGSFNTATQGATAITELGTGLNFYFKDRGADTSMFIEADLGYGGANSYIQADFMGGLGLGIQLFRTKEATFEILFRHVNSASRSVNTAAVGAFPNVDELRFSINW